MKITNLYPEYPILEREVSTFLAEWNNESKFIQMQTSGSTGNPKKVNVLKEQMRVSARMTGSFFKFEKNQKVLLCLSPRFIAGKMMIVRALEFGMHLILGRLESVPYRDEEWIDFAAMVPMQVQKSLNEGVSFTQVKHLIIGGAPISFGLQNSILNRKINAYATFGMTETLSHIALAKLERGPLVYKSLPGVEFDVDDRDCLQIRARNLLQDSLQTNDVVELYSNHAFIWKGRADFVINSGGVKLHPEEIEAKLKKILNCELIVFGESDELLGSALALILESESIVDIDWKSADLEKYQKPKKVYYLRTFERTETGKINRQKTIEKCS